MVELVRNPKKLEKARKELQKALDNDLEESHLLYLPFLQAIVKETLRLHPPVPLSVPRKSQDDAQLCGFTIPKNAQILVNLWAMGRDSSIWPNPNSFVPERFLDREINFKGRNFELIPFGAGRRMCPGLPLANRTVHLVLASLLRNYDWKLANGLKPEEMNMVEKFGLTLKRVQPLEVIPIKV